MGPPRKPKPPRPPKPLSLMPPRPPKPPSLIMPPRPAESQRPPPTLVPASNRLTPPIRSLPKAGPPRIAISLTSGGTGWFAPSSTLTRSPACFQSCSQKKVYATPVAPALPVLPIRWT
uniref:Uncharacterized protein n=1 Tax=Opuntia streptacantha TaxID=393608 RepID=A0A7C8YFG1_OPUST